MTARRTAVILGMLLIALGAHAQQWWHEPELVEADHVYTLDFETPHLRWARPLPGGPVHALFFVRAKGSGAREVAEIAQRLDLDFDVVYYDSGGAQVEDGPTGMARALRLIRAGADVFILGSTAFDGLSREAQYYLLKQVVGGAGLVCVGRPATIAFTPERLMPDLPAEVTARFPLASLEKGRELAAALKLTDPTDAELAARLVKRYRLGEGRALYLAYPGGDEALTPRQPFSYRTLAEYEYWAGFVAGAIRWAAGRDAAVQLTDRPDRPVALHRDDLPTTLAVTVSSSLPRAARLSFDCTLRRPDGGRISLGQPTAEVAPGQTGQITVEIPRLPAGPSVLEVIVSGPRGVETAGAQTLEVTSTRGVESIALDQSFAEVGEAVSGQVAMRGQNFGDDEMLVLRLRDAEDRVIAQERRDAVAGTVPFSFTVPSHATILMRAEAALVDADGEADRVSAEFRVPGRARDQFNFVMWDSPRGVVGYWGLRSLRDNGVTAILTGNPAPLPEIAANDLSYVPYTTRILETVGPDLVMEPECWNNEPEISELIRGIADRYRPAREHGVYAYSLGDENHTRGACAHPECLEAYRAWLADQYETIDALNASWDANFADFAQIGFTDPQDINENAALNAGHVARWYDRQAFKRYNYAVYCGKYARIYREMDPQAITGFEGAGGFGDDYDEIIDRVGMWGPYPSIGDDIIRSLAPRSLITSNWMGYYREPAPEAQRFWRMIANGYHGVWWWRWDNIGQWHGFLAPDFHPWKGYSGVIVDEMRDIRDGVGTMMLRMEMPTDGIALLYSMPSAFADGVAPRRNGPLDGAHSAFLTATEDLGFQAHYLSDRTVTEGALNAGGERALILPMGRAIPDAVAAQIREFVNAGGLLIADLQPGERDGHCKPRAAGVLDEVFGVAQAPSGQTPSPLQPASIDIAPVIGGTARPLALETRIDPTLRLAGGEALAEHEGVPLVVVNRFGAGTAVLLNFAVSDYGALRAAGEELPLRDLLGAIYAAAGIAPPFRQSAAGGPLRCTETVRWQTDGLTILGLFRTAGEDGPATTVLPAARHVYDLRHDRYLGETDRIAGELRLGYANLYALTDEPIGAPVVELRGEATPGAVLEGVARVQGRGQGLLPLRVRVFRPDGVEETWPRRALVAEEGVARFELPIAFNAMPGAWRVTVREVLSAQEAETTVTVPAM